MGSSSPYDLVFTTGFDNEQRKEMHQVARRFNLKSKSFGKGDDRHLTISKWVVNRHSISQTFLFYFPGS